MFVVLFTTEEVLPGLALLGEPQPHTVSRDIADVPPAPAAKNTLKRFQQTGESRAGL